MPLGLYIERKVDFLALAALILALITAAVQFAGYIRGSRPYLYPPDLVGLIIENNVQNDREYLRIAARMAYVNSGWAGYNSAVIREEVDFSFGDGNEPYSQVWQSEQQITAEGGELDMEYIREAGPFTVAGGAAVSREVYFAPFPVQCHDDHSGCDEFRNFIYYGDAVALLWNNKTMKFTFTARLVDRNRAVLTSDCVIDVGPDVVRRLLDKEWVSLPCFAPQK